MANEETPFDPHVPDRTGRGSNKDDTSLSTGIRKFHALRQKPISRMDSINTKTTRNFQNLLVIQIAQSGCCWPNVNGLVSLEYTGTIENKIKCSKIFNRFWIHLSGSTL